MIYHTHINLRNPCMCVCLSVCLSPPPGPKARKLGRRPQNWAEGPKTGQKDLNWAEGPVLGCLAPTQTKIMLAEGQQQLSLNLCLQEHKNNILEYIKHLWLHI